jgi:MFS superfamily sulfate permease-like transporter
VVFVGVEQGIIIAILLSLIDHTRRGYRPKNVVLVPDHSGVWRTKPLASQAQALPGLLIYRFNHSMYYANTQRLSEEIIDLANCADSKLNWFCIEASAVDDVDYSAAETLRSINNTLKARGIRLIFTHILDDVKAESRHEFLRQFGEESFYDSLGDVLNGYQQHIKTNAEKAIPAAVPSKTDAKAEK